MSLRNGLREVAQEQGWPWHVGSQLTLVAWHPDGSPWRPMPDIMVHPHAGPSLRREMDAASEGLPALIIEVASPTTVASDLNVDSPTPRRPEAKAHEYLAWPVPEYLVFDPQGSFLAGQVRAWHVVEGRVEDWRPDAGGRYHSALGVSFEPEGISLRIYDPGGRPVPLDEENPIVRAQLAREAAEARRQAEEARHQAEEARQAAEAERQARQRAEQEIAALRALVERLQAREGE
jgi:Uma2 family endonuclease